MFSIILATGGTGGHIFPAVALAKKLTSLGYKVVLFVDQRFDLYASERTDVDVFRLPLKKRGKSIVSQFYFFASLLQSYIVARKQLSILAPKVIVGFGGYASLPTLLAAQHKAIPFLLHEQNTVLGKVNRFFYSHAKAVATCFTQVKHIKSQDAKVVLTGNPIDQEFIDIDKNIDLLENLNLLIIGGSQGAEIFDKMFLAALKEIPNEILTKLSISQQCKHENLKSLKQAYKKLGIKADVQAFFVDVAKEISRANLVISRAGATAIAEITAACRPAVYIPYPDATENHQLFNARYMKKLGTAMLLEEKDLSVESLKNLLIALFIDRTKLITMNRNAKNLNQGSASEALVSLVMRLL